MTKGSWIHDDVSDHFRHCEHCRAVDPESARVKHDVPGRTSERDVPPDKLAALCSLGRSIYWSYLRWLAEPDE